MDDSLNSARRQSIMEPRSLDMDVPSPEDTPVSRGQRSPLKDIQPPVMDDSLQQAQSWIGSPAAAEADLDWVGSPVSKVTREGYAQCRVREAKFQRSSSLNEPPRLVRTVEIEPRVRTSSLEPTGRNEKVIRVSEQSYNRCGGDLYELNRCEKLPEAPPPAEELPELKLSFKAAYKARCTAEAVIRDPWRNERNADRIRVRSDMDCVLNQVWIDDENDRAHRPGYPDGDLPPITRASSLNEQRSRPRPTLQRRATVELTARANSLGPGSTRTEMEALEEAIKESMEPLPEVLYLASPNCMQRFSGRYDLVPNELPNGYPLWKQRGNERYLFSGRTGRWYLGGAREKEVGFSCSKGSIRSLFTHQDMQQLPHCKKVTWQANLHGGWVGDVDIKFSTEAPEQHSKILQVTAPHARREVAGVYEMFGDFANGWPLWKQRGGGCWLFSSTDGRWYVGGHEKKTAKFQTATDGHDKFSFCRSAAVHRGKLPEKVVGTWEVAEDHDDDDERTKWRADETISVSEHVCTRSEATERPFFDPESQS